MATKKEKLPEGWYRHGRTIWFRTDPVTRKRRSSGCRTEEAAKAVYAKREAASRDPVQQAAHSQALGVWVKKTIDWKISTKTEATVSMYNIKLGHAVRLFGASRPIAEFDAGFVDHFIATRLQEGAKRTTVSRELNCIRQMLRMAYRANCYPRDPKQVMPIGFSQKYVPVERTLTLDELPKLLDVLTESERAWVCFAIATGGDVGDVERAQPEDYDPATQTVRVRGTKTGTRDATIPVVDMFRDLVEYAVPRMPLSWPNVSKRLPERCKRAGVSYVTPKDLRRTGATWLAEAGVSLDLLARWLRHSNLAMAHQVYNKTRPEVLGNLIRSQIGSVTNTERPLGGMADAGDLKAASPPGKTAQTRRKPLLSSNQTPPTDTSFGGDLSQRSRERIARLSLRAAVLPELRPSLKLAKCLPEAYLLGAGDPDARGNIERALLELSEEMTTREEVAS